MAERVGDKRKKVVAVVAAVALVAVIAVVVWWWLTHRPGAEKAQALQALSPTDPPQSARERDRQIALADAEYMRRYAERQEAAVPRASPGYGFPRPVGQGSRETPYGPLPDESPGAGSTRFTTRYGNQATSKSINGVNYRAEGSVVCAAPQQHRLLGMVLDTCDSYCTHDNQCLAYSYNFADGTCATWSECPRLEPARAASSQLYVKTVPRRRLV